jgi:hypothetical protein
LWRSGGTPEAEIGAGLWDIPPRHIRRNILYARVVLFYCPTIRGFVKKPLTFVCSMS